MSALLAALLIVGLGAVWGVVAPARRRRATIAPTPDAEEALIGFVQRSLELSAPAEILAEALAAARAAFQPARLIVFEPGSREGTWEATIQDGGGAPDAVPDAPRRAFAWFRHNPGVVLFSELGDARYGAMRTPLEQVRARYEIDALVPLVGRGHAMGAIGLGFGRAVTPAERPLLEDLRTEVSAALLNVRLHREAALKLTLEKEVDLASAVQATLLPPTPAGRAAGIAWLGHYRPAGQAGSGFWGVYDLGAARVAVILGDAVGSGVAGSMVSAVAKTICDTLCEPPAADAVGGAAAAAGDAALAVGGGTAGASVEPGKLLAALNRALYRPTRPIRMTAFVAVLDTGAGVVRYASAAHPMPYVLRATEPRLGVLASSGPMLGDDADGTFRTGERALEPGMSFVLFSAGIVDVLDAARVPFGERRLQRLLRAPAEPAALRDRIVAEVAAHRGDGTMTDDETLLLVRVE